MALCPEHAGCRAQPDRDRRACHVLRPHPSAGAVFDVVDREDDELRADLRRPGAIAWRAALARRSRLGRAAPRRRSGGLVCDVRYRRPAKSPIAACPTMSRRRPGAFAKTACRSGWPIASRSGGRAMAKLVGSARRRHRRFHGRRMRPSRRHGDAVERDPSRHRCAAVDEDPAGLRGRGSRGHRQFRDGADDPAAAVGTARARLFRHRRFRAAGLCRDRAHPGQDALQPARRSAACLRRGERDRAGKIATALADLHRQNVIHHDIKPTQRHVSPLGRSRADRFRTVASQSVARFAAGGIPRALRHRALHGAGAPARRARRSAQRSVFARRAAVFLHHRRAAVRRERDHARHAAAAVARSAIRRANCGPTIRRGCRKSCCAASRSSRSGVIRPRRNWHSNSPIPTRSS